MTRKVGSGRANGPIFDREHTPPCRCTLPTPIRTFRAVAPSGGEIVFLKWIDSDGSLSFYHGRLTAAEDTIWWKAKLKAERAGIDKWNQARAILAAAGFVELDP